MTREKAAQLGLLANSRYVNALGAPLNIKAKVKSNRLFLRALESARTAIFITRADGCIVWVNAAFTAHTGYSEEELIGQKPSVIKSGKQSAAYYEQLWKTILHGESWSDETIERRKNGEEYTVLQRVSPIVDDQGEITHFISIQEDITDRKRSESELRFLAEHDPLTGLFNRSFLIRRLDRALSSRRRHSDIEWALIFIDLDYFKEINDCYGHQLGDELLVMFAKRLDTLVRRDDLVVRLGGDEFVILLSNSHVKAAAILIAQKAIAAASSCFVAGGHSLCIGASAGLTISTPQTQSAAEMMIQADMAMYAAKRAGRNTYRIFQPGISLDSDAAGQKPPE